MLSDLRQPKSELFANARYREGAFVCDLCHERWPLSHRRTQTGGARVGVLCCYDEEDAVDRDLRRARAARIAALKSKEEIERPLRGPDGQFYPGVGMFSDGDSGQSYITSIGTVSGVHSLPIALVAGGGAVTVYVSGGGFAAADTFAYGSTGITDGGAPALTGTTIWTLSVIAAGGTTPGLYRLVYAGADTSLIFQSVFQVK